MLPYGTVIESQTDKSNFLQLLTFWILGSIQNSQPKLCLGYWAIVVVHSKEIGMCILLGVLQPLPSGTQSCKTLQTC